MGKHIVIGSIESYSGKSGIILGISHQLQAQGIAIAYGKPVGSVETEGSSDKTDADTQFIGTVLGLSDGQLGLPLITLEDKAIQRRLSGEDNQDYTAAIIPHGQGISGELILWEGSGTLWEGSLFGLSTLQIAQALEAPILIVSRYHSRLVVDALLKTKQELGDRLLGVIINDVPHAQLEETQNLIRPFLEKQGIPIFGIIPSSSLLRSVSVREIAHQLKASVLCRPDRLDLMVEGLTIGAMNVSSALEYFRKGQNKAVITGGDRSDLQLAALETSTSCLILTGHTSPQPFIINRATDLEVPILSVDRDTLSTVEIVEQAFGQVRLQEQIKLDCIQALIEEHFDTARFLQALGLTTS